MNKKITVHYKQVIDNEVLIDANHTFKSYQEFEDALEMAIDDWSAMQGDYCIIKRYNGLEKGKLIVKMKVKSTNDYEEWTCIDVTEDDMPISLANAIGDLLDDCYIARKNHKKLPYAKHGKRVKDWFSNLSDEEVGKILLDVSF